jgi:hypothetical protein
MTMRVAAGVQREPCGRWRYNARIWRSGWLTDYFESEDEFATAEEAEQGWRENLQPHIAELIDYGRRVGYEVVDEGFRLAPYAGGEVPD